MLWSPVCVTGSASLAAAGRAAEGLEGSTAGGVLAALEAPDMDTTAGAASPVADAWAAAAAAWAVVAWAVVDGAKSQPS